MRIFSTGGVIVDHPRGQRTGEAAPAQSATTSVAGIGLGGGREGRHRIAPPEYIAPERLSPRSPMRWDDLRPVTLGETVHAFGVDGKRVDSKAVLKAMAKPKGVAVFVRFSARCSNRTRTILPCSARVQSSWWWRARIFSL